VESGKHNDRPQLQAAMRHALRHKATLLVAKLDRLSRNAAFLLTLRDSGVSFVAADMPEANTLTVGIMAVVAQAERELISARTKAAMAQVRIRRQAEGKPPLGGDFGNLPKVAKLGAKASVAARRRRSREFAAKMASIIEEYQEEGVSTLRQLADALNRDDHPTPRGKGGLWSPAQVLSLLRRMEEKRKKYC